MLLLKLWNYLIGYVIIYIENVNYEKVINVLKKNNILIWDIKRRNTGVQIKIKASSYFKHEEFISKLGITLLNKRGLFFSLKKLRRRKGFIIGFVFLIICMIYFCSFIWFIEIIGSNKIEDSQIIEMLNKNNITVPYKINLLNCEHVENILYENFESLKFVEAYVEGTKLLIYVKEKKEPEYITKESFPSSIISKKNAVINKIILKKGMKVVKEGDVVTKGQILINGMIKTNTDKHYLVHSEAIIYGQTYYNLNLKEKKQQEKTIKTDEHKSIYYWYYKENKDKIYGNKDIPVNYILETNKINIPVLSSLFDLHILKENYFETEVKTVIVDNELLMNKLIIELYEKLYRMCDHNSKILNKNIEYVEDDQYIYINARIEMLENIGETVRMYSIKEEE